MEDYGSARVVLVPQERALQGFGDFVGHAACDASGHFEISNCCPAYYAYAFDQQPSIKDLAELLVNHAVRRHGALGRILRSPRSG